VRAIVNVFSLGSTHWVFSQLFDKQVLLISIKGMLGGGRNDDMRVGAALCSTIAKKSAIYHDLYKEIQVNVFCNTSVSPTQSKNKIVHVMKFVDLFSYAQDASFICCQQHLLDMTIHVNIVRCLVQRTAHDTEVVATAWRVLMLRLEETDYAYGSQLRIYVLNHQ
jgi:hypothetical protein